jgi:hypothetical protein
MQPDRLIAKQAMIQVGSETDFMNDPPGIDRRLPTQASNATADANRGATFRWNPIR